MKTAKKIPIKTGCEYSSDLLRVKINIMKKVTELHSIKRLTKKHLDELMTTIEHTYCDYACKAKDYCEVK